MARKVVKRGTATFQSLNGLTSLEHTLRRLLVESRLLVKYLKYQRVVRLP